MAEAGTKRPVWLTCGTIITSVNGSILRVPCSQLQAVCVNRFQDEHGQEIIVGGLQCMRCFRVFVTCPQINLDWRPAYMVEQILPILSSASGIFTAPHILSPYPTDFYKPLWMPQAGHYCQAVYLVADGSVITARCATCGKTHALRPDCYSTLRHVPGPLVPVTAILFEF